jgi:hypothetical protein
VDLRKRWALLALAILACTRRDPPQGLGRRIAEGEAQALRVAADGSHLAYLRECRPLRDRNLPPTAAACELAVVPAAGGAAVAVAREVTNLGHGFAWSPAGHLLVALGGYRPDDARGELVLWAGGDPRSVARDVSFYAFDRGGRRVGWVSEGQLFLAAADALQGAPVTGADGIATFEFGGASPLVALARRVARAGGALLAVRDRQSSRVAGEVLDYRFGPDGERYAFTAGTSQELVVAGADADRRPPPIGRGVASFVFAPRGGAIAFIAGAAPGRQGDLKVAAGGAAPVELGKRVGEPRWTADGSALVWLQDYDPRSRTGTIAVGGPGREARTFARNVSDFDVTADGAALAYLVHETAGGFSVNLGLARVADGTTWTVARGVFGFSFSPDGRWLYYRTACTREAEACDLLRIPAGGPREGAAPERIAEGAKSFEFAPGRPERLLIGFARMDRIALDLAVWDGGKLRAVDSSAVPGSARFLGSDPTRLAYLVNDPKRRGVYVAQVP